MVVLAPCGEQGGERLDQAGIAGAVRVAEQVRGLVEHGDARVLVHHRRCAVTIHSLVKI